MSVSIISQPQDFNSAYNMNEWVFNSTNASNNGFRYIVEIIISGSIIGTYKVRPVPNTNYGEIDISKILSNQLGQSFDPSQLQSYNPTEQYLSYTLQVNEEYLVQEDFDDYVFAGAINWPNFSDPAFNPNGISRTSLQYSSEPVFEQGDIIDVAQDPGVNFRNELEGIHTVLDKYEDGGTWYLVLDLPWIGSGAASTGGSFYADGKKTIFTGITTSAKKVFRGAFSHKNYITYDDLDYTLSNAKKKLITTLPDGVAISKTKPTWLKIYKLLETAPFVVFVIDGTSYRYECTLDNIELINILPATDNIDQELDGTWSTFTGSIDLTNVESYTIQLQLFDGTPVSEERIITLYSDCDYHTTYDVCFMDRLGSWITVPFNKGDYMNQQVERQEYRKKFDFDYTLLDRGLVAFDVQENIEYTINTGILSEVQAQYMKELVSTPFAFVSINGEDFEAINITTTSIPLHKKRTQRDRKVSITFVKSVQDSING